MNELTTLGKALRKIRIDLGLRMRDMADAGDVSVSFLSAVETGAKTAPAKMISRIALKYALGKERAEELQQLAIESAKEVRIKMPAENESRAVVSMFARRVAQGDLTDDQLANIKRLLKG